jgi:hypothetical protein
MVRGSARDPPPPKKQALQLACKRHPSGGAGRFKGDTGKGLQGIAPQPRGTLLFTYSVSNYTTQTYLFLGQASQQGILASGGVCVPDAFFLPHTTAQILSDFATVLSFILFLFSRFEIMPSRHWDSGRAENYLG